MAAPNDSDLKPGLLALGALVLGVAAVVLLWNRHAAQPTDSSAASETPFWDSLFTGAGGRNTVSSTDDPDAGVPLAFGGGAAAVVDWHGGGPALEEGEDDPQVRAMRRSFGDDAGMAADFTPYAHRGHAVRVAGVAGVDDSASCDVRVLPVRSEGGFNCVVRVRCDGVTVYPDSALVAGYAPCNVEGGVPSLATDGAPSDRDGDPELMVDLNTRRVRIHDVHHGSESTVEIVLD